MEELDKYIKYNFAGEREIGIGYYEGGIASVSTSILKYKNMAKKLAEKYPDEVTLLENMDGSIYMIFPPEWIRFPAPKKNMSEENKIKAANRLKKIREKKNEKEND